MGCHFQGQNWIFNNKTYIMHKNTSRKCETNIFLPLFSTAFSNTYGEEEMKNKEAPASL